MAKSDKSLVKVDVNIGNEVSANRILDKITGATGIIFGAYKEKQRAKSNFLAEINNRMDLSNIDKLAITSNYKKILREYENQNDIVNKALELLNKPVNEYRIDSIDNTWIMNFMDYIKNICDEELKIIWSKVLAGELEKPGKYSLRTLEEVKKISKKDAELFSKLAGFIMKSESTYFILNDNEILEEYGISYEDIILLDEIGFIKDDAKTINYVSNQAKIIYNDLFVFIVGKNEKLSLNIYKLTEVGEEVFSLLQNTNSNINFLSRYAEKHKDLKISYSEIVKIEGQQITYNSNIKKLYNEDKN